MTVRVARWSATHPWRAIIIWLVFVAASIVGGSVAGTQKATDEGNVGEAARAEQFIDDGEFPEQLAVERILITARSGELDTAEAMRAADDAAGRARNLPEVADVEGPVPSPDGTALMLSITMNGDPDTASDRVQPLLDLTAAVQHDHPALLIEEAGDGSIIKDLNKKLGDDFVRAELFSIPVTLVILLIAFGALIAAGVPVLLALSAVGSAIGLAALASHLVPAFDSVNNVILLIGMAVGVDYSLFYLRREREERARGAGHLDAVEIAAATSGHAVVVSGLAVIISMSGMFLANDGIFTSFAVGSILVVGVSMLGSLTVLPAILAKLGRWVDRPRIPLVWRLSAVGQNGGQPRLWTALLTPALRHPVITLMLSVGALVALAVPAFDMKLKLSGMQDLPREVPSMVAYEHLTAVFPSTGSNHTIVVKAAPERAKQVASALDALAARTATDPLFAHDQEPVRTVSPNQAVTTLEVGTPYFSGTTEAEQSLNRLRDTLLPQILGQVDGAEYAVTGEIAGTIDYAQHVREKLPIVVGFVLVLTFLVMAWTFRSLVVAASSIMLNLLSVGAAYGLLVLVFQHTWAESLLDFRSTGGVVAWLPLFLFVVLFGLSMDYHVFVVSRVRETFLAGASNRDAVAAGITKSAGVVTSAAVVMVGVFSIFGTLSFIEMKQLGVGLAAAILIDATIIRAVVLPSLMTLLGKANWWAPKFLGWGTPQATAQPDAATAEGQKNLLRVG